MPAAGMQRNQGFATDFRLREGNDVKTLDAGVLIQYLQQNHGKTGDIDNRERLNWRKTVFPSSDRILA